VLSLERCREMLGEDAPEGESELRDLRDELYAFAHILVDVLATQTLGPPDGKRREPCE
jgi:hypothetical protein